MTQLATPDKPPRFIKYETDRGEVALSVDYVRKYFCPNASPQEAFAFIQLCRFHRLNPYLREAYLVKYGQSAPAQFIIGYQAWTQRAERDPKYQGFRAGLIIARDNGILEHREGTFYRESETLEGGWCEVNLAGRASPVRVEVALHEYIQRAQDGKPNRFWAEKPGTMIRKVAIAQAHREAFPSLFAGLYSEGDEVPDSELPADAVVVEGSGSWLDTVAGDDTPEAPAEDAPRPAPTGRGPAPEEDDGLTYEYVLERAGANGLDRESFEARVLGKSLESFMKVRGATPALANLKLTQYLNRAAGAV